MCSAAIKNKCIARFINMKCKGNLIGHVFT